ncbi:SctD/MshK family protein [Pseudomonas viridiflava]|uniref:SctD/MshK family protein n=1 Tax=Pseudomonas viridiflava TaxID=33069 RepID=UPI000F027C7D|nr:FHA domain-containing protein [Pseudomonas viridiflava]MEE4160038.1 FHA domain-containing protein [Pseudomonas viridiflava]
MTALISFKSTPDTAAPGHSTCVLEILQGLHKGVSLALDKPSYSIGSAAPADLILSDTDIAAQHVRLVFGRDPADRGQVAIEASGGDVAFIHASGLRAVLAAGTGQRVRLPVELELGQARLCLRADRLQAVVSDVPNARSPRVWALFAALTLLLICATAFALHAPREDAMRAAGTRQKQLPAAAPAPTLAQAQGWLEQALKDAGLQQLHLVSHNGTGPGGQLGVEGTYSPEQKGSWLQIQRAFDSQFGQHIVLTPKVQLAASVAKPRVRFQAVWFGPDPYVIDEHGKRVYPGAALQDNWTLEGIADDQVRLVRGQERFVFTL